MKFSTKAKTLILKRARGKCEICGVSCINGQIHHRRPRGMGGSKSASTGSAANGVLLHPACHLKVETNRNEALNRGWLVRQGNDPEVEPFRRYDGWFLFKADGTAEKSEPKELFSSD